jgi:hypothetical protein
MGRLARLGALLVCLAACSPGPSSEFVKHSPSPSASATIMQASPAPTPTQSPAAPTPYPVALKVACKGGSNHGAMVMIQDPYAQHQSLYDVADPVHPRLLCSVANTSAHIFTGDAIEWLKPISANETDVMLHSLGSGNDRLAGTFPFRVTSGAWLPDLSVMAYTTAVNPDDVYIGGATQVWLYSQHQAAPLFTYGNGIGDCICRFGLPPEVLAISPDGQYLVAGRIVGKGSVPLAVYRVADRTLVTSFDISVNGAFWERTGHRLFLDRFGTNPTQGWTPEAGVVALAGAAAWSFLPGLSPDGSQVAYTAYTVPGAFQQLRTYIYDVRGGSTRMVIDKLRSQVLFIKSGWVWYLEEVACEPAACGAPWGTQPSGRVFAMPLSGGTETAVSFAAGEDPVTQAGSVNWLGFGPGEFWPAT